MKSHLSTENCCEKGMIILKKMMNLFKEKATKSSDF